MVVALESAAAVVFAEPKTPVTKIPNRSVLRFGSLRLRPAPPPPAALHFPSFLQLPSASPRENLAPTPSLLVLLQHQLSDRDRLPPPLILLPRLRLPMRMPSIPLYPTTPPPSMKPSSIPTSYYACTVVGNRTLCCLCSCFVRISVCIPTRIRLTTRRLIAGRKDKTRTPFCADGGRRTQAPPASSR